MLDRALAILGTHAGLVQNASVAAIVLGIALIAVANNKLAGSKKVQHHLMHFATFLVACPTDTAYLAMRHVGCR